MSKKLVPCIACGHMVSRRAKICPNCGEKKPFERSWQRYLVRILTVLLLAGLIWWVVSPIKSSDIVPPAPAPALTESDIQTISERLYYLSELEDVAWWVVKSDGIHIGVYTKPLDLPVKHTDILNGAVFWGATAIGSSKIVSGFLYEASHHDTPGANGEGAICRSEGRERVENTQCLIDGEWTSHNRIE